MSRFKFLDDIPSLDLDRHPEFDLENDTSHHQDRVRLSFESKHLKERNEIHRLNLELEKLENLHYEGIRECRQQLYAIEKEVRDRRDGQQRTEKLEFAETVRRSQLIESEAEQRCHDREQAISRLTDQKARLHSEISRVRQQIASSRALHEGRVAKLRAAIGDFNLEIQTARSRKEECERKTQELAQRVDRVEQKYARVRAENDAARERLQAVRLDSARMASDYDELRGAQ
jgi:chromosome segregation ATPase